MQAGLPPDAEESAAVDIIDKHLTSAASLVSILQCAPRPPLPRHARPVLPHDREDTRPGEPGLEAGAVPVVEANGAQTNP